MSADKKSKARWVVTPSPEIQEIQAPTTNDEIQVQNFKKSTTFTFPTL